MYVASLKDSECVIYFGINLVDSILEWVTERQNDFVRRRKLRLVIFFFYQWNESGIIKKENKLNSILFSPLKVLPLTKTMLLMTGLYKFNRKKKYEH